jgi:hypothetical protein
MSFPRKHEFELQLSVYLAPAGTPEIQNLENHHDSFFVCLFGWFYCNAVFWLYFLIFINLYFFLFDSTGFKKTFISIYSWNWKVPLSHFHICLKCTLCHSPLSLYPIVKNFNRFYYAIFIQVYKVHRPYSPSFTLSIYPLPPGFTLARQVLYHLNHASSPFCSDYFGDGGVTLLPRLAWTVVFLF